MRCGLWWQRCGGRLGCHTTTLGLWFAVLSGTRLTPHSGMTNCHSYVCNLEAVPLYSVRVLTVQWYHNLSTRMLPPLVCGSVLYRTMVLCFQVYHTPTAIHSSTLWCYMVTENGTVHRYCISRYTARHIRHRVWHPVLFFCGCAMQPWHGNRGRLGGAQYGCRYSSTALCFGTSNNGATQCQAQTQAHVA